MSSLPRSGFSSIDSQKQITGSYKIKNVNYVWQHKVLPKDYMMWNELVGNVEPSILPVFNAVHYVRWPIIVYVLLLFCCCFVGCFFFCLCVCLQRFMIFFFFSSPSFFLISCSHYVSNGHYLRVVTAKSKPGVVDINENVKHCHLSMPSFKNRFKPLKPNINKKH